MRGPVMERSVEYALIRRAKEGDEEAVEALIRAHQDALYAFILRMSGRRETAEDIVQEAFVRVLKNLHRFDNRFRFSTWLFTIAKRLYMNLNQKLGPAYDTDLVQGSPVSGTGPGGQTARTETMDNARILIDAALAALPTQQREIMLLFHQQSWPIADIAEHLDMPQGTVKSHLHRGRARMRRFIEANRAMHRQVQEVFS
jgi:RNA polymerase sigma-70 factor (ECF subfamily)